MVVYLKYQMYKFYSFEFYIPAHLIRAAKPIARVVGRLSCEDKEIENENDNKTRNMITKWKENFINVL